MPVLAESVAIPKRVADRAILNVVTEMRVPDLGPCLISTYSTQSEGYAQIGWTDEDGVRRGTTAHRASWVWSTGEQVPDGMTVDHICRQRQCVRPPHLRLLSNPDNASDNGQVRVNGGTGVFCSCGDEKVMREGATYKPYCRRCQNRRRRARRALGKAN